MRDETDLDRCVRSVHHSDSRDFIVSCAKLWLFPRLINIFDIRRVVIAAERSDKVGELARVTIARIQEPVSRFDEEARVYVIRPKGIKTWFETVRRALSLFRELGFERYAFGLFVEFLSMYLFLLAQIAAKEILPEEMRERMIFKFEETSHSALRPPADLVEALKQMGFYRMFRLGLSFLYLGLQQSSPEDEVPLAGIIGEHVMREEELESSLESMSEREVKVALSVTPFILEALPVAKSDEFCAWARRVIGRLALRSGVSAVKDVVEQSFRRLAKAVLSGDEREVLSALRDVGSLILDEKIELFGLRSDVLLRTPPDTISVVLPPTPPTLDVLYELDPNTLPLLLVELHESVKIAVHELHSLLRAAVYVNTDAVLPAFKDAIRDPLGYVALALCGFPEVFLHDISFLALFSARKRVSSVAERVFRELSSILKEELSAYREVKKCEWGMMSRLATYVLARLAFHLNARMSPDARSLLSERVKEYVETCEQLLSQVEADLGYVPRVSVEREISQLFA